MIGRVDELSALEYNTLKMPYEELNRRFRVAQKGIERANARVREVTSIVGQKLDESRNLNVPIKVKDMAASISELIERLKQLEETMGRLIDSECQIADNVSYRAWYLHKATTAKDEMEKEKWESERVNRLLTEHMLRCGYFNTANNLAEQKGLAPLANTSFYVANKKIIDSLRDGDTGPCLEWCMEHRSKLRRLGSDLETTVRMQDAIEMVRQGKRLEALNYVRKHFNSLPKERWSKELLKLMGVLACGINSHVRAYQDYASPKRWNELVERFKKEHARIFQLNPQSAFAVCVQMGLCALKTPHCHYVCLIAHNLQHETQNGNKRCAICRPRIFELAALLPHAHATNSRLVCAYSGEPLNEDNVPMMLGNGYVYGEKSIRQLREGEMIRCPRTGALLPISSIARVYVL